MRNPLLILSSLPASILIALIRLYQRTLSPDHGFIKLIFPYGLCRHEVTCSQYAAQVLQTKSLAVALLLIAKRIVSCHPWATTSDERLKAVIRSLPETEQ